MSSRIEPVKRAAKMIPSHFDGVIAWVTWRLSNGRLEGMNNKIRLLSHRSLNDRYDGFVKRPGRFESAGNLRF